MAEIGLQHGAVGAHLVRRPSATLRPSFSTITRSATLITSSIACSISRMPMPRSRARPRITPASCWRAGGDRPDRRFVQQQQRRIGRQRADDLHHALLAAGQCAARADRRWRRCPSASSSRARAPCGGLRGGRSPARRAGRRSRLPTCACRPTSTFSSAVRSANRPPFWNVRRTPRAEIACGVRLPGSPRRGTGCGRRSATTLPEMALNSVVLPAPFGPISAQISPALDAERHVDRRRPGRRTARSRRASSSSGAFSPGSSGRRRRDAAAPAGWRGRAAGTG